MNAVEIKIFMSTLAELAESRVIRDERDQAVAELTRIKGAADVALQAVIAERDLYRGRLAQLDELASASRPMQIVRQPEDLPTEPTGELDLPTESNHNRPFVLAFKPQIAPINDPVAEAPLASGNISPKKKAKP
jgi:hypothetical protein